MQWLQLGLFASCEGDDHGPTYGLYMYFHVLRMVQRMPSACYTLTHSHLHQFLLNLPKEGDIGSNLTEEHYTKDQKEGGRAV